MPKYIIYAITDTNKVHFSYNIMKTKQEIAVEKALNYAVSLKDTPYVFWTFSRLLLCDFMKHYMYVSTLQDDLPSIDEIKEKGTNCAGLTNLIRRHLGLSIPGINKLDEYKYPGGTYAWFNYLERKGRLEKFDYTKSYPSGTLLLRNYKDINDQGHVAIIYAQHKDSVLFSKVIHSYPKEWNLELGKTTPGVTIDATVGQSHFGWFPEQCGFYTHVCYPKNWLVKD